MPCVVNDGKHYSINHSIIRAGNGDVRRAYESERGETYVNDT
ncbi:uncharacterized protein METZ01_LOCUS268319, partial [marine metagenome]